MDRNSKTNERALAYGVCDEIAKAHDGAGLNRPVIDRLPYSKIAAAIVGLIALGHLIVGAAQ